ncbi:MAG: hypothetical protein WC517_04040 [Patescibacteria group bacterium]
MKFYDNSIVARAREKRKKGFSLRAIGKELNISDATISRWVYDIKVDNRKQAGNREKIFKAKKRHLRSVKAFKINRTNSRLLCSLIYWCEGAKYPINDFVALANSDELLIKTFIKLFRKSFTLDEGKFRVQLQLHESHNEKDMINYWSKMLRIPKRQFHKSTITAPKNKMKRHNYYGTCTVKYYDVKILWQMTGLYELLGSRVNGEVAEWLKAEVC